MSVFSKIVLLLTISNAFMLTAWYLHLKYLNHRPLLIKFITITPVEPNIYG
jgi:hypothetical protein